jgi:peptidyl-prolyl cis-trans isomerase SurA
VFCDLTLLSICLAAAAGKPAAKPREVVDRIAAVIENEIITQRELETKAEPYMAKLGEISDPAERLSKRQQILRQVLDIEIDDRIVKAEIGRSKDRLGVTEKDVDRAIQEVLRMNNLNEDQLQAALYSQGVAWAEYRERLRSQIERARLIQFQVQGKVKVDEAAVKRRCEERSASGSRDVRVCASHILRVIPDKATAEEVEQLRARLSQLQAELAAGADFAAFALKHSDDKAAPDGDIGCFGRGEMVEVFEAAALKLEVGQVSPVVRSPFGFHIIKVTDRRQPSKGECSDDTALDKFRNEIYQEEMESQMKAWLRELRKKAFVEVRI